MQLIKNDKQFIDVMNKQVLYPLLKSLSNQIVAFINKYLKENSSISTDTIRKYTTFDIKKHGKGYQTTIFINSDNLQSQESVDYGIPNSFNRFISLNGESDYANETIAWHMVSWLEEGVLGKKKSHFGNQPIKKVGMFENTYKQLEKELPNMIEKSLKGSGLKVVNK